MIFLSDRWPRYCPNCGHDYGAQPSPEAKRDWEAGASQGCLKCGAKSQFVPTGALLETAEAAGGDLARYARWP